MEMDERFSHIVKDPRFKKIPNRKKKVKIDSRFQQMFDDENFNTKYFVDKRGRKVKESASEDLSNFYELSDENDETAELNKEDVLNREESSSDVDKVVNKKTEKRKKVKKEESTSDDKRKRRRKTKENEVEDELEENEVENELEENEVEDELEENEVEDELEENEVEDELEENEVEDELEENEVDVLPKENVQSEVDNWQNFDAEAPTTDDATKRLAVCNMDWDKITADDLFVLLNSFVPSGGSIITVKIYPSEFGLERMEREDEIGPTELVSIEADDNEHEDQGEEYNKEKLRQYQLNRLKYFYGVVECDSSDTAEKIYEECDGMEYEASSSHLDLRFIPEDMTFDQEPTSQATDMPSAESYKPSEFITTALQQSTVRLTWDETDPRRVQTTMRSFSKDDILDMDFKAYLASSSDEDSDCEVEESVNTKENQDSKIAKYKELLEEINKKEDEEEEANEMEITWDVGLKESAEEMIKRKKNEKERKELTPWENYLNERKKKKKVKQHAKQNEDESQSGVQLSDDELPPDVDLNDPFLAEELRKTESNGTSGKKEVKLKKKNKKKGENPESEEDRRRKAELQLLMMEDDDGKKHFSLKSIMKNEKSKKKRRKKQEETKQDDFEIDVNDTRFSALYSSHLYAVDPSDPQFKKTKAMDTIIREKQRRSEKKNEKSVDPVVVNASEVSGKRKPVDHGLSALVKNVKSNAGKFNVQKNKNSTRKSK